VAVSVLLAACASTAVPSQERAARPTAAPGASQPAGSPVALADAITEDGLGLRLDALAAVSTKANGWRTTGSKGYDAAADYVVTELKAAGWTVSEDTFRMAGFFDDDGSSVVVGGSSFSDGDVRPLIYAPPGDVTGPVVAIGWDAAPGTNTKGCQAGDYAGLPGNAIVLVAPGPCIRRTAIQAAQAAGARAFVAAYPGARPGMALRATLLRPDGIEIPAVGATKQVGDVLAAAAERGGTAHLVSSAETRMIDTRSIIGQLDGTAAAGRATGASPPVIMLGAHLDSVLDGPGINDNGSGVAALLETAQVLGNDHPKASIRLGFWAGEELGLWGSTQYVGGLSDADRAALLAYVNADMVASPNGFAAVDDDGRDNADGAALEALLTTEVQRAGGSPISASGAGSDHVPFAQAGVTIGGVHSGATEILTPETANASGSQPALAADACYHQACDDRSNVRLDLARILAIALAETARTVARAGAIPAGS
jgi:Zn-dependent M28 family amino/carboxypeptidase